MQKLELYTQEIIKKTLIYFGKRAEPYCKSLFANFSTAHELPSDVPGSICSMRFRYLESMLSDPVLIHALHLAVAQYLYPDFYYMLQELTGQGLTLHFTIDLSDSSKEWTYLRKKEAFRLLSKFLLVEKRAENFEYTVLYADQRLVDYLAGNDEIAAPVSVFSTLYFGELDSQELYGMSTYKTELRNKWKNPACKTMLFQLSGKTDRGKKRLLKQIAREDESGWLFIDAHKLQQTDKKDSSILFILLLREALFYNLGICIDHADSERTPLIFTAIRHFLTDVSVLPYPLCICTETKMDFSSKIQVPLCLFPLPDATRAERIAVWDGYAAQYQIPISSKQYGSYYRFEPGIIARLMETVSLTSGSHPSTDKISDQIASYALDLLPDPKYGQLQPFHPSIRPEDLKLEEKQRNLLYQICGFVRHSNLVYDSWNMESRFLYGHAAAALFCGPPGTGKTMGACILSSLLRLPLYRVDLSQVTDKYIGETEKKLDEIFSYAENSNVILFFDEADALFGKRSEVKEAKDRYANTEVSFLLQRIEQYSGVVILASNFRKNIDEAFMRRMRYVVEFKMPDYSTRLEVWKSGFSKEIPTDSLDYEYLAKCIELSGGYIKNIILNGIFLAAGENTPVSMKHLLLSACNEYQKLGKSIQPSDFEKYAYLFYDN